MPTGSTPTCSARGAHERKSKSAIGPYGATRHEAGEPGLKVAFARAARTLALLALIAWVGAKIYGRHGSAARQRFDDWVASTQPRAAQVLQALCAPVGSPAGPGAV